MKLFPEDPKKNWLPINGIVNYYGKVLTAAEANFYYQNFLDQIEWKNDEAIIFGKRIVTARKVAWYADQPFPYRYSGTTKLALPWTEELLILKDKIEMLSGEQFNSCLMNLYHNGNEGMAWHSDGERELKKNGAIASVSLGAERKFAFKLKKGSVSSQQIGGEAANNVNLFLEHGSLLIMKGTTQSYWQHRLPPTKKVLSPRINLTFRTITSGN